jgi:flagellar basal body-associated protein FliL
MKRKQTSRQTNKQTKNEIMIILMIIIIIIQFNSIIYYLCAESKALRPITDTAQSTCKYMLIEKHEQETNKQTNKQTNTK